MKRIFSVFFLVLFVIMISACSREAPVGQKEEAKGKSMNKDKFSLYQSALLKISFQYPPSWQMKEIENPKGSYRQIHLVGPRREDIGFPVSITITAFSRSESLKDEVIKYLLRKKRLKDFNLLKRSDDIWADETAEAFEFTYLVSLPLYSVKAQQAVIQERTIFFKKGEILYKVSFFVDRERFAEFTEVLENLKESLSFSG
ncbi:MAG: PsbP-related protein [Candidatus Ratteibacteria bacterium]|nr:PsbP-related protein [Candidatus Ratteibacteria bacterium]